mmetsp:Transcript_1904/g.2747  ORF Transcript_1904/g.2747 Transcript_1904/m.2747 type:complete len:235 (-) Transcript_1904:419-1123(-)
MSAVLVDLIATHHTLEEEEGVEIFVLPAGCVVENADGRIHHLVIADHEQARVEHRLVQIVHRQVRLARQRAEVLLNQVDELLVIDGTGADNDDILAEVVALVEVSDHLAVDLANVVNVTENGLAHHVIAIDVEVDVFHEGFLRVLVRSFKLLPDGVLLDLEVVVIIHTIAEHVTEDLNTARNAIRETQGVVESVLAASVGVELRTRVLHLDLELASRSVRSTFEMQVLQEVGST